MTNAWSEDQRRLPGQPPVRLGVAGSDGFVIATGALVVLGGIVLGGVRIVGASPAESLAEQVAGGVGLGAVVAAPGLLARLGVRSRPALLLPAAMLLVPLSFLSLAGATLPLLIPAVMLAIAYGRRTAALEAQGRRPGRSLLSLGIVLVLLVAAAAALFARQDPRSYSTPTESGSTSDVITVIEAVAALVLIGSAMMAGWALAAPRDGAGEPARARTVEP